jgi:hypothetical protein
VAKGERLQGSLSKEITGLITTCQHLFALLNAKWEEFGQNECAPKCLLFRGFSIMLTPGCFEDDGGGIISTIMVERPQAGFRSFVPGQAAAGARLLTPILTIDRRPIQLGGISCFSEAAVR